MSSTQEAGDIFGAGRGPAHAMLRSPTVLIASVGLWGMNVFFFRLFRIDYVKIFKHDLLKLEEQEHDDYERHHPHQHPSHALTLLERGGGVLHHKDTSEYPDDSPPPSSLLLSGRSNAPPSSSSSPHRIPPGPSKSLPPSAVASDAMIQHKKHDLIQRQASYGNNLLYAGGGGTMMTATTCSSSAISSGNINSSNINSSDVTVLLNEEDESSAAAADNNEVSVYNNHHQYYNPSQDDDDDQEMQLDLDAAISWSKLVGLSVLLLFLLHTTYFWWLDVLHGGTIGAVFMFYTLVLMAITMPIRCTRWLRKATVIVVQRTYELINPRCHCITNDGVTPPRFIPFVDVFYADAMCSLSKVFFDWGMLFHMATHYPNPVPASAHNILIPSACAAVPYIIRARQCLIMYTVGRLHKERNRFSHLWNAFKYSTSIFPLCLSAYQQTVPKTVAQDLESLLIFLLVVNTVIALYWDIVMDWGMMQENPVGVAFCNTGSKGQGLAHLNPHKAQPHYNWVHVLLRPKLRFGFAMSTLILIIDCVLRFSWMLRFHKHTFFPNADSFVLCTQFLEVFRRALWNLLRVEWENIKQSKTAPHSLQTKTANTVNDASGNIQAAVEEELKNFLPSSIPIKINTL